jgi:Family of unknown function (DUF5519)
MNDELLLTMVEREVQSWPGVTSKPGRFGATSFRYGKREIGHIHHDRVADLPVTSEMREDILARGRARPHPQGLSDTLTLRASPPMDMSIRTICSGL